MKKSSVSYAAVVLLAALCVVGCSGDVTQRRSVPQQLISLGDQFRTAPADNRMEMGKQIREVLPTCLRHDSAGRTIADYARPTYFLSREDVIKVLGQPNEITETGDYVYTLGSDQKYKWALLVEFWSDHVALSRIDQTWSKKR